MIDCEEWRVCGGSGTMVVHHNRCGQIGGNYLRCDLVSHTLLYLGMCLRGHFEECFSKCKGKKKNPVMYRCPHIALILYFVNFELSAIHSCLITGLC